MSHIFLSYSQNDIDFARRLRGLLQDKGFRVWMDETKLVPSESWWKTIEQNIIICAAFIIIMSPNSAESDWVEREILTAEEEHKPIFPVLLTGSRWRRLANIQYENMTAGLDGGLRSEFVDALQRFVPTFTGQRSPPAPPAESIAAQHPIPSMRSVRHMTLPTIGLVTMLIVVLIGVALVVVRHDGNVAAIPTNALTLSPRQQGVVNNPTSIPNPTTVPSETRQLITDTSVPGTAISRPSDTVAPSTNIQPMLTNSPSPLGFPGSPVTSNAEWKPYIDQYVRTIEGIEMVLVPAGCFDMGDASDSYTGDGGRQCFEMPFYISRYEITNSEFDQMHCTATQPSTWEDEKRPRENVTWIEARDCAAKMGGRLPTEAEWEYAARGPDDWVFPWGNDWKPDNLVWSDNSNLQTVDVGSKPNGASWEGADDMAGNVWEWTSSIYQSYPYIPNSRRENDRDITSPRSVRGGSWFSFRYDVLAAVRDLWDPSYRYFNLGFRLVLDDSI